MTYNNRNPAESVCRFCITSYATRCRHWVNSLFSRHTHVTPSGQNRLETLQRTLYAVFYSVDVAVFFDRGA